MDIFDFEHYWRKSIVIWANYTSGKIASFGYQEVQSRFLVWCVSGGGELTVNLKKFKMFPGKALFVPWNHMITYQPFPSNPFCLGCIHIIPEIELEPDEPIYFNPFHSRMPTQKQYYQRHDEYLPGFEGIYEMELPLDHPLFRLGSYIIDRFASSCPSYMLQMFPRLLLYELFCVRNNILGNKPDADVLPNTFKIMLKLCYRMLEKDLNISVFTANTGVSESSVYRLFQKYTGMSPGRYIMELRLEHATRLLCSTSLSVGEIATRLKFKNQFYFSKCFKRRFDLSPREFRQSGQAAIPELPRREEGAKWNIPLKKKPVPQLPDED